jgi:hypothetical protein
MAAICATRHAASKNTAILGLTAKLLKKHSAQAKSIAVVEFYSQKPHGYPEKRINGHNALRSQTQEWALLPRALLKETESLRDRSLI